MIGALAMGGKADRFDHPFIVLSPVIRLGPPLPNRWLASDKARFRPRPYNVRALSEGVLMGNIQITS